MTLLELLNSDKAEQGDVVSTQVCQTGGCCFAIAIKRKGKCGLLFEFKRISSIAYVRLQTAVTQEEKRAIVENDVLEGGVCHVNWMNHCRIMPEE